MVSRRFWGALSFVAALSIALCGCAGAPEQESRGERVADSALTANVKAALTADPRVRALFVDVSVSNGVVRLSGFADSRLEADAAVSIANDVRGVKRVQDDIVVRVSRDRRP